MGVGCSEVIGERGVVVMMMVVVVVGWGGVGGWGVGVQYQLGEKRKL